MNLTMKITASALALAMTAGIAIAQVNSPVGQNRAENQLSQEQAAEVARPAAQNPSTTANVPTGAEVTGTEPNAVTQSNDLTAEPTGTVQPYTSAEADADSDEDGIVDLSTNTPDPSEESAPGPGQ